MNKIIEWHKQRWKERRVAIGYLFWLGLGSAILIFQLLGIKVKTWPELITLVIMNFFGMYLVFRYDLFVKGEVTE